MHQQRDYTTRQLLDVIKYYTHSFKSLLGPEKGSDEDFLFTSESVVVLRAIKSTHPIIPILQTALDCFYKIHSGNHLTSLIVFIHYMAQEVSTLLTQECIPKHLVMSSLQSVSAKWISLIDKSAIDINTLFTSTTDLKTQLVILRDILLPTNNNDVLTSLATTVAEFLISNKDEDNITYDIHKVVGPATTIGSKTYRGKLLEIPTEEVGPILHHCCRRHRSGMNNSNYNNAIFINVSRIALIDGQENLSDLSLVRKTLQNLKIEMLLIATDAQNIYNIPFGLSDLCVELSIVLLSGLSTYDLYHLSKLLGGIPVCDTVSDIKQEGIFSSSLSISVIAVGRVLDPAVFNPEIVSYGKDRDTSFFLQLCLNNCISVIVSTSLENDEDVVIKFEKYLASLLSTWESKFVVPSLETLCQTFYKEMPCTSAFKEFYETLVINTDGKNWTQASAEFLKPGFRKKRFDTYASTRAIVPAAVEFISNIV